MFSDLHRQTDRVVTALIEKYTQITRVLGVNWSLNIFYMHNYYIIIYLIIHSIILNSTKTKIWILYALKTTKCHALNIILFSVTDCPLLHRRYFIFIWYDKNLVKFFHILYVKKS